MRNRSATRFCVEAAYEGADTISCRWSRQEEHEMSAKRLTKAQVIAEIAESSELDKKSVGRVFDGLTELIKKELRKPNGEFVIPGLLKLRAIKKAATKDRPGINPFTKAAHHHQGQAGSEEGPRHGAQGPQGPHPVTHAAVARRRTLGGRPPRHGGEAPFVFLRARAAPPATRPALASSEAQEHPRAGRRSARKRVGGARGGRAPLSRSPRSPASRAPALGRRRRTRTGCRG